MPDLGTVEGNVTLVRWLKAEGDIVALGEPLFEVETDKGVSEVEAAIAGVLLKKLITDGAKASAGETIALIRRPDEAQGSTEESNQVPYTAATSMKSESRPPLAGMLLDVAAAIPESARNAMTPVVRALAHKLGVDLATIRPTGPGGRITREDVLRAKDAGARMVTGVAPAGGVPLSLSHEQTIVARKVSQSYSEKPVYRVNVRVDMSAAIAFREKGKASGTTIKWDALFVKAAAMAIAEMQLFRRYLKGEELAEHDATDVAVAVGIDDDLFIPAIRGAAGKSVAAVSREIELLAKKAASRALQPADVEGSCFLVSNLGMFPIDSFDAIIYPDHSAALAVGATTPCPVSDGKNIWIAPIAQLSLSVDHRVINGKTAGSFCRRVKQILENGELA
jgi:pyruvate dehydrogenase E2 component (dihydrolipoamide acetyltransferase)